jgi:hypothetical protein
MSSPSIPVTLRDYRDEPEPEDSDREPESESPGLVRCWLDDLARTWDRRKGS